MEPTLKQNQLLLIRHGNFAVGDVVLFMHDGLEKVKRVTEMRGDRVFVAGDNAAASTDSRHFGVLSKRAVIGKVVWPKTNRRS